MRARRARLISLLTLVVLLAGCAASSPSHPELSGSRVEVVGAWSGAEQEHFTAVLKAFHAMTGARVSYVSAHGDVPSLLDKRIATGALPDVALLPQPGLLRGYAERGRLVPLDAATLDVVRQHYARVWQRLATVHGRQYGVWFKAADKSLIWYSVGAFEKAGVVPPADLAGLLRITRALHAQGIVPFSVGGADGWTLTDWFENLYLHLAGPQQYSALAADRVPWTDPSVTRALRLMRTLLQPRFLLGGVGGTMRTDFESSVARAFGSDPGAAMLMEGDFVASVVTARTHAALGSDVDMFAFPGTYRGLPVLVGGGDVAVQLRRSAAGAALMQFLASPAAAAIWAREGGFISPNQDLDLAVYPDAMATALARSVIEAGDGFRFDLSDLQPGTFGSANSSGLQAGFRQVLEGADLARVQGRLQAQAQNAFGR